MESKEQKVEMQGRLTLEFRARSKGFAAGVIRLLVKLPKVREEVRVLGRQLLRAGTSVAAHVREASRARSDDEFMSKLGGAMQEADESQLSAFQFYFGKCGRASRAASAVVTPVWNRLWSAVA